VVPIGYVGVVVSYYGQVGRDLSGDAFRHGERVAEGERGVWERPLGPGKYPFNTYAGNVILVPTTNFVLHWITGKTESHRYDESLRSIDLVTKDAYEPLLPLSVVVHIDYQKAPSVIQRFGDVKKLITQTLDPMLSAYFRDVAHKKTMLELLHQRDAIQAESREELRRKFRDFDIECVDVLIGKPDTAEAGGKIETLLEQLRIRQLSIEQLETYERQRVAAEKQRTLNDAQAQAAMQTQLTNSQVQVRIAESQAEADLARARKHAEQTVVNADAELAKARRQAEQTVMLARAESEQKVLAGRGQAQSVMQVGLSEATVLLRKIASFGDPRLYALSVITEQLTHSSQPLVPERVFMAGGSGDQSPGQGGASGMLGLLLNLLVAEKSGFQPVDPMELSGLKEVSEQMTREALETLKQGAATAGVLLRIRRIRHVFGHRSDPRRDAGLPQRTRHHGPAPHPAGHRPEPLRSLRGDHDRPMRDVRLRASGRPRRAGATRWIAPAAFLLLQLRRRFFLGNPPGPATRAGFLPPARVATPPPTRSHPPVARPPQRPAPVPRQRRP
jgi:regulator of protease activity HflC (stomatin/prohibitin superfamily)